MPNIFYYSVAAFLIVVFIIFLVKAVARAWYAEKRRHFDLVVNSHKEKE